MKSEKKVYAAKNIFNVVEGLKQRLYEECIRFVSDRIAVASEAVGHAKEAAEGETRSSAGDKYETGRAMAQLEIEKNTKQLNEARLLQQALERIDVSRSADSVQPGTLVVTDSAAYFLAVSAGRVELEGTAYLLISPAAPIGQAMRGRKAGDSFVFAGKKHTILKVV